MIGLNLGLWTLRRSALLDQVRAMFAAGEQGGVWDPSDFTTMAQDSAGTIPLTALEQSMGMLRDLSPRGNHRTASLAPARSPVSGRVNKCTNLNANPVDTAGITVQGSPEAVVSVVSDTGPLASAGLIGQCSSGKVYLFDNSAGTGEALVAFPGRTGNLESHEYSAWVRSDLGGAIDLLTTPSRVLFGASAAYQRVFGIGASADTIRQCRIRVPVGGKVWVILNQLAQTAVLLPRVQSILGSGSTAADYDATGWPVGLRRDGVDDGDSTGVIDFTGTSRITTVIGIRKLSDAALGSLIELGESTTAGCFRVLTSLSTAGDYRMSLVGTLTSTAQTQNNYVAPLSSVVTNIFDLASATRTGALGCRVNGVVPASQTAGGSSPPCGGNFQAAPLYFGKRANGTSPFIGMEFPSIVLGRDMTEAELAIAHSFVNSPKTQAF